MGGSGPYRASFSCSRRKLWHVLGESLAPHETLDRQAAGGARASGRRPSGCRRACAAFSARRAPGHRRRVHAAARRKTVAAYYRRRRGRQPSARPRLSRAAPHGSASEAKAHGRRVHATTAALAAAAGAQCPLHCIQYDGIHGNACALLEPKGPGAVAGNSCRGRRVLSLSIKDAVAMPSGTLQSRQSCRMSNLHAGRCRGLYFARKTGVRCTK